MKTNFLTCKAEHLEQTANIQFAPFAVSIDRDTLYRVASKTVPERLHVIQTKVQVSDTANGLLDQLGIDYLIEFMGVRFAIDVTTGKSSVIKNKIHKMKYLAPLLSELNAIPVILTCRTPTMRISYIEQIIRASAPDGIIDCRINLK